MKDSDRRNRKIFSDVLRTDDEKLMTNLRLQYKLESQNDITKNSKIKEKFQLALYSALCQNSNGLQYINEIEVRHYLREFNQRTWNSGLLSMPAMFNIMESFFEYNREIIYFELLEEETYNLSLEDFIDYIKEGDLMSKNNPIESIEKDVIYHLNFPQTEDSFSFKTDDNKKYLLGNASLIRRGDEATVVLYCGQYIDEDMDEYIENKKSREEEATKILKKNPRKRGIEFDSEKSLEIVKFMEQEDLWATTFALRFDLKKSTIDLRFIARDLGNSYEIRTDDLSAFTGVKGKFPSKEKEAIFVKQYQEIELAGPIFEVAKFILYIPFYMNLKEDEGNLHEMIATTNLNELIKGPLGKRKFSKVPSKFKSFSKPIYLVNSDRNIIPSSGITITDNRYIIEKNGFWKKLKVNEHGTDKDGNPIVGKTWVEETQVYYKNLNNVANAKKARRFTNKESGYIYIMRKPMMEEGICKIGLTKREIEERRKEFSGTNTLESFQILYGIETINRYKAEKLIHEELKDYRISMQREFFKLDIQFAISVVNKIVNELNNK